MSLQSLRSLCKSALSSQRDPNGPLSPQAPNLMVLSKRTCTKFEATLYNPVACLILEGAKEVVHGSRTVSLTAGQSLLVSHDLAVSSRIVKVPYLALVFVIDIAQVRRLYEEVGGEMGTTDADGAVLDAAAADAAVLDCFTRLLDAVRSQADARVLVPLITKELHYRLLRASNGAMLRRLLRHDSHASAISRAIEAIRDGYKHPLTIADLATKAGMSVSSFHKHFKAVTTTTPLQYQKDLRLIEARQQLSAGTSTVSQVAFDVGYESPNQFSREYARKFGHAPKTDLGRFAA